MILTYKSLVVEHQLGLRNNKLVLKNKKLLYIFLKDAQLLMIKYDVDDFLYRFILFM